MILSLIALTFDQHLTRDLFFFPLKIGNSYCGWAHPLHFKTAMKWRLFLLVLGLCQPLGFLRNLLSRSINYFNQSCFPIRLSVPRPLEEKLPNICGDKSILVSRSAGTFPPWSERLDLCGTLTAGARVWGFGGLSFVRSICETKVLRKWKLYGSE